VRQLNGSLPSCSHHRMRGLWLKVASAPQMASVSALRAGRGSGAGWVAHLNRDGSGRYGGGLALAFEGGEEVFVGEGGGEGTGGLGHQTLGRGGGRGGDRRLRILLQMRTTHREPTSGRLGLEKATQGDAYDPRR
jgi:hypothetical protein